MKTMSHFIALYGFISLTVMANAYAESIAPPAIGQETKGTPAVLENVTPESTTDNNASNGTIATKDGSYNSKEYKRENGQVYRLELQHPNTPNQYIDKTGSDGNIESTDNDIEDTPNLPKWKLGSW